MWRRNYKVDIYPITSVQPIEYSVRAKCGEIVLYNDSSLAVLRKETIGTYSAVIRRKLEENPNTQVFELPSGYNLERFKSFLANKKFTCLDAQAKGVTKILDILEIKHETVYHEDLKYRENLHRNNADELWIMM